MEVEVAPFLQTKLSPWIPPLLCNFLNGSQEKLPALVSMSAPPLTDFKELMSRVVKLPVTIKAPPMVWTFLKVLKSFKLVLLATTRAPPMVDKLAKETEVKSSLETMLKDWPTDFKLSTDKEEMELLMKPKEELTDSNFLKETSSTSLKVMLLAHSKSSKVKEDWSPLKENCRESLTVLTLDFKEVKYLLLLMLKTATSSKSEKPSMDSREVSEIRILLADFKFEEKVEMAGKVIRLMVSTSSREPKEAEVRMVKLCKARVPVTFCRLSAAKLFREVALLTLKEP